MRFLSTQKWLFLQRILEAPPIFARHPTIFRTRKLRWKKPHLDGFRHSHEGPIDGLPGFASRQGGGSFGTQRFNEKSDGKKCWWFTIRQGSLVIIQCIIIREIPEAYDRFVLVWLGNTMTPVHSLEPSEQYTSWVMGILIIAYYDPHI